jgi:protein-disulfide isomerase
MRPMMKKSFWNISVIFGASLLLSWGALCLAGPPEEEIIATLNGEPLYLWEVEQRTAFQIYRLRGNIYSLLKRETEEIVDQRLLAAEAARRGLTVEELLRKEVNEKVPPLDEKKVDEYLAEHPGEQAEEPQRRARIRTYLSQQSFIQHKLDFIASLRKKADFEFLLEPPQHSRTRLSVEGEPWMGNPDAPVTLVHFASFSCKLCSQSTQKIRRIMEDFPGKIKWVHRNFFSMFDEKALTAALAAEAAHEQERFWDFHDRMFALGGDFEPEDVAQIAGDLGLGWKPCDEGEKAGRFLLKVKDDIGDATKIGLKGVPVIFVNGIHFGGTFPYEQLKTLVQRELDRNAGGKTERR